MKSLKTMECMIVFGLFCYLLLWLKKYIFRYVDLTHIYIEKHECKLTKSDKK